MPFRSLRDSLEGALTTKLRRNNWTRLGFSRLHLSSQAFSSIFSKRKAHDIKIWTKSRIFLRIALLLLACQYNDKRNSKTALGTRFFPCFFFRNKVLRAWVKMLSISISRQNATDYNKNDSWWFDVIFNVSLKMQQFARNYNWLLMIWRKKSKGYLSHLLFLKSWVFHVIFLRFSFGGSSWKSSCWQSLKYWKARSMS